MNSNDLRLQILRNAYSTDRNAYSTLLTLLTPGMEVGVGWGGQGGPTGNPGEKETILSKNCFCSPEIVVS